MDKYSSPRPEHSPSAMSISNQTTLKFKHLFTNQQALHDIDSTKLLITTKECKQCFNCRSWKKAENK